MQYMNEGEIQQAVSRHARHPVLGPATRLLAALKDLADNNSDGWAYWKAPVKAADKLMTLIHGQALVEDLRDFHERDEDGFWSHVEKTERVYLGEMSDTALRALYEDVIDTEKKAPADTL